MINAGLLLNKAVTVKNIIYVTNVKEAKIGRYIRKKAFKTKEQAEQFRLQLCEQLGTQNIKFWPLKPTTKQGKGYTMYSFNNMDIVNRQGQPNKKPPSRLALLFQDREHKPRKPWQFIDLKYDYNKLPVGVNKCA